MIVAYVAECPDHGPLYSYRKVVGQSIGMIQGRRVRCSKCGYIEFTEEYEKVASDPNVSAAE